MPNWRGTRYRVILLRSSPRVGGVERVLLWLARALQGMGVDAGLALFHRGRGEHPLVLRARAEGVPAWSIPDGGPWDVRPLFRVRWIAARFGASLIHSHDCRSNFFAFLSGWPWVPTVHGYTRSTVKMRGYEVLDRWVIRRALRVVVPSDPARSEARGAGVADSRIRVVMHGLDWERIDRWAQELPPRVPPFPLVLFLGRFSKEKGGGILLQALSSLVSAYPELEAWFVGSGPKLEAWHALARTLGLTSRVVFWGWQDNPFSFLQAATLVAIPSYRETFGLSAVEAQGLGVPVVASTAGGLPHVLSPPGTRFFPLHEDGARSLAAAMHDVLANWEEYRKAAEEARSRVRQVYRVDKMARGYVYVYREVLRGI